ncbi:helix-turn-helix domain-containing protein [Actinobacillus minor]|uniref:helix-turn-helix domain-containing protein n=1 Tax=Actinobacillus minor TaxID=51047 RepID=UPI002A840DE8|nr:helix-turn-helix domain-containing protein [Actinobacillus minor]MDY4713506.1 helix-turn-helix domain-containing protein [Actinobacillus minor]
MKNFTDILNRLKTVLSFTQDKQIAEILGLSKSAFAERKRRGVFPEDALRLLEIRRPDLKLDVDYVLHGVSDPNEQRDVEALERIKSHKVDNPFKMEVSITPNDADTSILLNMDEMKLLANFRRSDNRGKQLILDTAKMCKDQSLANLRLAEYTQKEGV